MAVVGRYELREELGRGGVGVVWRAHDPRLGRDVAIKLLVKATPRLRQRIAREGRAMARLDHPGIVKVLDSGETADGSPWVALELIQGGSLQARLDAAGPLPILEAVRMTAAVADALAYAHAQAVVHRDVKPANILLGADGAPRLGDFGLVKELRSQEGLTVSVRGQAVGTPGYFPPEQALGEPDALGPAADVYALGATLHALLTGTPPQETAHDLAEAVAAAHRAVEPPSRLREGIDPELDAICTAMLAVAPGERPAALEVLQRLRTWQTRSRAPVLERSRGPGPATYATVGGALVVAGLGVAVAWRARSSVAEAQARQAAALAAEGAALARAREAETARLVAAGEAEQRVREALARAGAAESEAAALRRAAGDRPAPEAGGEREPGVRVGRRAALLGPVVEAELTRLADACDPAGRAQLLTALRFAALARPWRELEVWVRAAARLAPHDLPTTLLRAWLALGRDQYAAAEAALDEALAQGGDADQLTVLRGVVLWLRGDGLAALARWEGVVARRGSGAWGQLATRFVETGRGAKLELRPASADPFVDAVAALVHIARMDLDDAAASAEVQAVVDRLGALDAHLVERSHLRRVSAARSEAARDLAMADYVDHLRLVGASSRTLLLTLTFGRRDMPRWEPLVLALADEACDAEPARADLCYLRGVASLCVPDPAETILGWWRKALERDPAFEVREDHLAEFRRRHGDTAALRQLLALRRAR